MKRNRARQVREFGKRVIVEVRDDRTNASSAGSSLLKDDLSLDNVAQLAKRIAAREGYNDADRLVICEAAGLSEKLESRDDIAEKPIFVLCRSDDGVLAVFCLVQSSDAALYCLYKDFISSQVPESVRDVVVSLYLSVEFKMHREKVVVDMKNQDVMCLKTLESMMVQLRSATTRDNFMENFDNDRESFFQWITRGADTLRKELFSLVKDGYDAAFASDVDQLSRDVEFKRAIRQLLDSIPLLDELDDLKAYQRLLQDFVEAEEKGLADVDVSRMRELERARARAFGQITSSLMRADTCRRNEENGTMELHIVRRYPAQMAKFARIFEPLMKSKVDEVLDERLREISDKLGLDYKKLKSFFENREESKVKEEGVASVAARGIEEIVAALPRYKSTTDDPSDEHKTLEKLLAEMTCWEKSYPVDVKQLTDGHRKVKERYKQWSARTALDIHLWAASKKGRLADADMYEALAVMDRANELVTGGRQKLRDTQILALLSFLRRTPSKGQLAQIQTGEGKTTIVSILAAVMALRHGRKIDVVTSNPVLASDGVRERSLFYELLDLSVATNNADEGYRSGARVCYRADVVYGSMANFQFDYLRDSFLGLATRAGRPYDTIVLDEVDSMMIDNASHIAKLSGSLPGMESLKYVYIRIWQALHKAEDAVVQRIQAQLKSKALELRDSTDCEEADKAYELYREELQSSIPDRIKEHVRSCEPTKIGVIPSHVREYAERSLEKWIDNAMSAKYQYREDEQYVIRPSSSGERAIQPVDYANTGVTLKNTIWQHGLHQFLQLKHNLHLTAESPTSCFVSNLGYINRYENDVFGLTGTLGSEAEQQLLSAAYNLTYAKIPSFAEKRFVEIEGEVVDDESFGVEVAYDALCRVDEGRAALVICETISNAKAVRDLLLGEKVAIRTFLDEENAGVTETEVRPGEVVIATNIAGRGTDFRTSDALEANGGLHVCVAFLPCNKRVEDQAFGRTARQGNRGTAKLIVKRSEIERLGFVDDDEEVRFEDLKRLRDVGESERIREIRNVKIVELEFQDKLFSLFCSLYRQLQARHEASGEHSYVLDDLKEYWAFWLEKQDYGGSRLLADKTAAGEFSKFECLARETIRDGKIRFNPYYSILQAEHLLAVDEDLDGAERALKRAIEISDNPEILHTAYVKLFEIAIERGGVFADRCKAALADTFVISPGKPDREYKSKAKEYLRLAQEAFKKEFDYIDQMFKDEEFGEILVPSEENNAVLALSVSDRENRKKATSADGAAAAAITSSNDDTTCTNAFVKHVVSRQQILNLNMCHASQLAKQIDECGGGLCLVARIPDYFSNPSKAKNQKKAGLIESGLGQAAKLYESAREAVQNHVIYPGFSRTAAAAAVAKDDSEDEKRIKQVLTEAELAELAGVGGNNVYGLRQIHDVCPEIARAAKYQVNGGITLIAIGICCPPALPVTAAIGNVMIVEGLTDVAIELTVNFYGDGKFRKAAYIKGKLISYGMSLLTLGISAALQCPKILNAAKRACRWIAETLRNCKRFAGLCKYLATKFEKLAEWFAKLETLAKFNQLSNAEKIEYVNKLRQKGNATALNDLGAKNLRMVNALSAQQRAGRLTELTHLDKCFATLCYVGCNVFTSVLRRTAEAAVMSKVVMPLMSSAMSPLKPMIRQHVEEVVREKIERQKFRHNSYEDVRKIIQDIKDEIDWRTVRDIFQECILGMAKHCGDWRLQLGALALDQLVSWSRVRNYAESLCAKINARLKSSSESCNDKVDELADQLINQLTEEMHAVVVGTTIKSIRDVYSVARLANANRRRDAAEEAKCRRLHQRFKDGGMAGQEQARATSDVIERPIHIYEAGKDEPIVLGEHHRGEPVKLTYYPPDEKNPKGHYVPHGESEYWTGSGTGDGNDCFFQAVASTTGRDPSELRNETVEQIDADPRRYMASEARHVYGDGDEIFKEGGDARKEGEEEQEVLYPSHKGRIKVSDGDKEILALTRNRLNEHKRPADHFAEKNETEKLRFMRANKQEPRASSRPGKTDMMTGVFKVTFKGGSKPYKRVAVSGDESFGFKGKVRDYEILETGRPRGKVYDVFNKQYTDVEFSKSCAAQKFFSDFGEYMLDNDHLEIDEIYMAESMYRPGSTNVRPSGVWFVCSCRHCVDVLMAATGAYHKPDYS